MKRSAIPWLHCGVKERLRGETQAGLRLGYGGNSGAIPTHKIHMVTESLARKKRMDLPNVRIYKAKNWIDRCKARLQFCKTKPTKWNLGSELTLATFSDSRG